MRMHDEFEKALRNHANKVWQSSCTFAGREARIRIVGLACAEQIIPPFRHLLEQDKKVPRPDLLIDIWDASETGVSYPGSLAESDQTSSEFGFIMGAGSDRFIGCQRPNMLSWIDRSSKRIIVCTPNSGQLALHERAKPLLFPLMLWHCDRDTEVIHAALVEKGGHGVLFAGREGAGKSTAALACLEAGFNYLGDDYLGLKALDNDSFLGYSLYNSTWLEPNHALLFPNLAPHVMHGDLQKLPVVLSEVYAGRLGRVAPIRVLVLPRVVAGSRCRTLPASKREALFALAPSSLLKRPCSGQNGFNKIAHMVERVPSYVLEVGADLRQLTKCVEELTNL